MLVLVVLLVVVRRAVDLVVMDRAKKCTLILVIWVWVIYLVVFLVEADSDPVTNVNDEEMIYRLALI